MSMVLMLMTIQSVFIAVLVKQMVTYEVVLLRIFELLWLDAFDKTSTSVAFDISEPSV